MAKKKKEEKQPFAIQQLFMHKAKPWRNCSLPKNDSALNGIIRRLKCANASKLFTKKSNDKKLTRSNSIPKYPFLTRNLERSFNGWSSFEQKCRDYASQKTKESESKLQEEEDEKLDHAEPIVEFPPEEGEDHPNNENIPEATNAKPDEPAHSGLTRWKNTTELMPSPIVSNQRNKHCLNDYSFETVQSLPTDSPGEKFRSKKPARNMEQQATEPMSSTMPFMDRSAESCLPSTPSFMREWKAKSRRRQLHSTPKNAFS